MANDADKEDKERRSDYLGEDVLKGYYYVYGSLDQTDRYIRTTKKITDYVAQRFTKSIGVLVSKGTEQEFKEPDKPKDEAKGMEVERYKMLLKMCLEKQERYQEYKAKVFRIIMGQCKASMRNKLEALEVYEKLEEEDDVAGLMEEIRKLVYATDNTQFKYWRMQASWKTLVNMKQADREALQVFATRFLKQVESTEEVWGELYPRNVSGENIEQVQKPARDGFLACLFLAGVDRKRYKSVIDDLSNDFILGKVSYPKDVPGMLNLLVNRRGSSGSNRVDAIRDGVGGISFAQSGSNKYANYKCNKCKQLGHIKRFCPQLNQNNTQTSASGNDSVGSENRPETWNSQGFQVDEEAWHYTG